VAGSKKDNEASLRTETARKITKWRKYDEKYLSFGFKNFVTDGEERSQCLLRMKFWLLSERSRIY